MKLEANWKGPDKGLIVSLDVESISTCLELAGALAEVADVFKIPSATAIKGGADFLKEISRCAPVFLDLKIFDIPNTMDLVLKSASQLGVRYVTAHTFMGFDHLKAAVSSARKYGINLIAVTILTSVSQNSLPYGLKGTVEAHVKSMVTLAREAGAWGVVCSVKELPFLQDVLGHLKTVCPGIRISSASSDDQVRTATPSQAREGGAHFIVVGRPIIRAPDPVEAARHIRDEFMGDSTAR